MTFLTIPRHWNTCSDGSVIPEHGKRRSKSTRVGIPAASSPNINLSTNMASEVISQHLILKIFLGEHAPRPPSACVLTHTPSSVPPPPPPNRKYLPPPMNYLIYLVVCLCQHWRSTQSETSVSKVDPIVLKVLMIMLCCTAQEMCHLCS